MKRLVQFALVLSISTLTHAAIIIDQNQAASGSLGTVSLGPQPDGLTLQGVANGGAFLNFTSNELLSSQTGGGQARLEAVDGSFSFMSIEFADGWVFDRIVFNLIADVNGNATISAFNHNNILTAQQVIALSSNGQNFINVDASSPDLILRVVISMNSDSTTALSIDSIQQVRVGGIQNPITGPEIPEPGSILLLSSSLAGVGWFARRRRRA